LAEIGNGRLDEAAEVGEGLKTWAWEVGAWSKGPGGGLQIHIFAPLLGMCCCRASPVVVVVNILIKIECGFHS
jgi:hypothetical protein